MVSRYHLLPALTLTMIIGGGLSCTVGTIDCVQAGIGYDSYQYAICVAKSTLEASAEYDNHCRDNSCWLPCTLISKGRSSGQIPKQCQCDPNLKVTSRVKELDMSCYIPKGDNCEWYSRCLETRIPCDHGYEDARYAIKYAKHYCDKYSENYRDFTPAGKRWIDATRKCLQRRLVPYLLTSDKPTCSELKRKAFKSHVPCYVTPDGKDRSVSVCSITLDYGKILKTIGKSFINEFLSTSGASILTSGYCVWKILSHRNHVTGDQIAAEAVKHIDSTDWLFRVAKNPLPANSNKCNLFVADILNLVGADAPNRKFYRYSPIGAREWEKWWSLYLHFNEEWFLCSGPVQRGDVIATGGHVGIVTGPNRTTSASAAANPPGLIVENDWGFRAGQEPTCWRYYGHVYKKI